MTAEQLEAARSERMRHNGHAATQYEDVRTWIEETGLCLFLPRSVQAGFTAPTFVEAVAGGRVTDPTLELIATAEELLVRLEAEGVAVRLSLNGQPGDQPDYVVAAWVLPYIYALRGDRDWRRPPQLTGSRQVSPLAVQVAKQLESGNQNAGQLRDALGREVTESATLRALHELWRQLRVIPVVPAVGKPALWQPLRQRFQKAIAEGASTSQVTAISVLASIYLQAVIAASLEDIEMFLSALTARSKIREVVRGLAATRQVHTTTIGQLPLYYVAGTLPEFPAEPSFAIGGSTYLSRYQRFTEERDNDARESLSLAAFADRQQAASRNTTGQEHVAAPADQITEPTGNGSATSTESDAHPRAPRASNGSATRPAVRSASRSGARPDARANSRTSSHSGPRAGSRPTAARSAARPASDSSRSQKSEKSTGFARKAGERGTARPATRTGSDSARTAHGAANSERNLRSEAPARSSAVKSAHKPTRPAASDGTAKPATRFKPSRPAAKSSDLNGVARPANRTSSRTTARPTSRAAARPTDRRSSRRPATEGATRTSASKRYTMVGASSRRSSSPAKPTSGNRSR